MVDFERYRRVMFPAWEQSVKYAKEEIRKIYQEREGNNPRNNGTLLAWGTKPHKTNKNAS